MPILPELHTRSSIGRSLDPGYPNHRRIMLLTLLAGLAAGAWRLAAALVAGAPLAALQSREALLDAALAGFFAGAAVFMAWVLARELDIEHEPSALLAAGLALAGMLFWGAPAITILPLGLAIIALRMVNRVVGPPFRPLDSAAAAAGAGLAALLGQGWTVLGLGLAFLLDARLADPLRRHQALGWMVLALGGLALALQPPPRGPLSAPFALGVAAVALAFGLLVLRYTPEPASPCDDPTYRLDRRRVRAAMAWALLVALVPALWGGDEAVRANLPLWAALAAAPLYRAARLSPRARSL